MATVEYLFEVQAIIEYNFRNISILVTVLIAAGADERILDGNRKMAQLSESPIELLLADDVSTLDAPEVQAHVCVCNTKEDRCVAFHGATNRPFTVVPRYVALAQE